MVVGEFTVETDLAVIGGGPSGYSAAFRAAELGIETTLIDDRDVLGGAWLHEGCILTKELVHLADTIRAAEHAAALGVSFSKPAIDLDKVRDSLKATVRGFSGNLAKLCEKHGVTLVQGRARFDNSRQLSISNNPQVPRIHFRRAIIAAGSRVILPKELRIEDERIWGPREALDLQEIPERLLVVGGSASALELASMYATMGSKVTLVDQAKALVPTADRDLVEPLERQLHDTLAALMLNCRVAAVRPEKKGLTISFTGEGACDPQVYDRVLVAVGRSANVEDLQLDRTKSTVNAEGFIEVDEQMRTQDPRIFAVGDVLGPPMLTLKATHQGRIAAEAIAGWGTFYDARAVPMVLFTDPQIAWCGMTEREAIAQDVRYAVHRTRWAQGGQTTGMQRVNGFTKIIYDLDAQVILGVGIIGPNAAELIAEGALAVEMGAVVSDLAATIHPHPTHSEFMGAAALEVERETQANEGAG